MLTIQIIPKEEDINLVKEFKEKLKSLKRSTFYAEGRNRWRHERYWGWINFDRDFIGVCAKIQSKNKDYESQIASAYIGWVLRYFRDKISSINIQSW